MRDDCLFYFRFFLLVIQHEKKDTYKIIIMSHRPKFSFPSKLGVSGNLGRAAGAGVGLVHIPTSSPLPSPHIAAPAAPVPAPVVSAAKPSISSKFKQWAVRLMIAAAVAFGVFTLVRRRKEAAGSIFLNHGNNKKNDKKKQPQQEQELSPDEKEEEEKEEEPKEEKEEEKENESKPPNNNSVDALIKPVLVNGTSLFERMVSSIVYAMATKPSENDK